MDSLQAIIWDFDGTLVNSEPYWHGEEKLLVAEHGGSWTDEDAVRMVGQHVRIAAQHLAVAMDRPDDGDAVMTELISRVARRISDRMPYMPGALEIVEEAAARGLRQCIVTASNQDILDAAMAQLPSAFEFIITANDVTHPKPNPEAYELALQRLDLPASQCVILEDSISGSAAGLAAGGYVVGVPMHQPLDPHPRMAIFDDGLATTNLDRLVDTWRQLKDAE
ncbi:HAD family phosphatase [uncultured Tessaracoccus sp.]|uniref:HAD family hydrolase n=1 Tax=uncultured Tessaracoccus sp. TaxID=905023 RepID=UPI002634A4A2|nr:HAD-IA family hydrolase [uncultured Tessaracoccus sp.]